MEAAIVVLVVAVLGVFIAWLVRHSRAEEAALKAVWTEFARRAGYQWVAASGPWYGRVEAQIRGESEGAAFVLDRYHVSTGKSSVVFTRVRATLRDGPTERVLVRHNNWFNRVVTHFSAAIVTTGDASFDSKWFVRCKSAEVARKVVDARVRERLLGFTRAGELTVKHGELTLVWQASESDARVLESAVGVAAAIAHATSRR